MKRTSSFCSEVKSCIAVADACVEKAAEDSALEKISVRDVVSRQSFGLMGRKVSKCVLSVA